VFVSKAREVRLPFVVDAKYRQGRVVLFVSSDSGKSWKATATVNADVDSVQFVAPADGVYWFDLQLVPEPMRLQLPRPQLRVLVKTQEP